MQGALKEPASRFGPVFSSSPPIFQKSARSVHVQQPKSGLAAEHAELKSLQTFFLKPTNTMLTAPSSTVSIPNALQLSKGPLRASKDILEKSTLLTAKSSKQVPTHRAFATSTTTQVGATKPKKTTKPTKEPTDIKKLDHDDIVEMPAPLPVYDYSSFTPQPTKKYIRTTIDAERELDGMVGPLGFDIEWRVLHRKGMPQRPVAVVQIADQRRVLIIQTSAMKVFPKKLREILEDPTIIKTGVNVRGDAKKMYTDHKVKIQNLVELSWLSRQSDSTLRCGGKVSARTLISLQKLAAAYLGKNLVKSEIRTGNWEAFLTPEQVEYAANDAHCSVVLYHHFIQLAKIDKRTLQPHVYTMDVNLAGEVVSATEEIASADKDETEDLGSSPPPPRPVVAKVNKVFKPPRRAAISTRPPEIIELSDSESEAELRQLAADFNSIHLDNYTALHAAVWSPHSSVATPVGASTQFGRAPLVEEVSAGLSQTMAFALGLKK